jgi:phosphoribosyl-ATP pyrophosphohydrolase/phosphoribosyl-AMP cyclohydrolase
MDYNFLKTLEDVIESRKKDQPENSYVADLSSQGLNKISQKVGEEAVETVIAALAETDDEFKNETADLIFHLLILLNAKKVKFSEILEVLEERHKKINLSK